MTINKKELEEKVRYLFELERQLATGLAGTGVNYPKPEEQMLVLLAQVEREAEQKIITKLAEIKGVGPKTIKNY